MLRLRASLLACIIIASSSVRAQDTVSAWGVAAASTIPATTIGAALYQNYVTFWKKAVNVPFHFSSDPPYSYHNDKFGHAYYTAIATELSKQAYMLAGLGAKQAVWIGAGAALLAQTLVEFEDGNTEGGPHTGFSPGDAIANVLGAALPVGKEYVPWLRGFDFKLGFYPSDAYNEGGYKSILDDNESRYYWISYTMSEIVKSEWYPRWLNIAAGHSAENLRLTSYLPSRQGKHPATLLFIGFDLNLKGLPIEGKAWKIIAEVLSYIRIPFPALQITPIVKWRWLSP